MTDDAIRSSPVAPAPLALFSFGMGALGTRVADALGTVLAPHEEREFEWGQHKCRPLADVRGHDAVVIGALHGDERFSVNDRLCRLLFFLAALRDHGATRVSAIVPFLCYSRKDRRTKPHDPVTTRYVAQLFEAVGVDHVATIEVHNTAAFDNAFRCPTTHIDAAPVVADWLARAYGDQALVAASPDSGGIKRARHYADVLGARLGRPVPLAFVEKYRSDDVVSGGTVVGEVADRLVVLIDDLIAGGTTLARAAAACRAAGARAVVAAAVHGAFASGAAATLAAAPLERIAVLDHLPATALDPAFVASRLQLLPGAGLIADAIRTLRGTGGTRPTGADRP
ncbi:MAG: ribose-phosphate diphosphokinase [Vicinamibacterales bacterium]